jgi:undecaprenyl-diphosphatase
MGNVLIRLGGLVDMIKNKKTIVFLSLFVVVLSYIYIHRSSLITKLPITGDNFHCVKEKVCYRSGQLDPQSLKTYIDKYNIKSILNLRGTPKEKWLHKEQKACKERNVTLYSIPLTHSKIPSREKIKYILHVFDTAQKPLLIHCKGGADRTGMISALWQLDQQKTCVNKALEQLSVFYGHVKLFHPAMSKFIRMWKGRNWFFKNYYH